MAVSACYGTVGSGKTYDAMCRIIDAMEQHLKVVTINMQLIPSNIRKCLVTRGMSYYDADVVVGKHEELFTENRFRELKGTPDSRIYLVIDEGHFWFPQNTHYKISLEDVLQVAMSRKKFMDLHLISQLNGQINREVAGLSSDNWIARPLKIEPFYSGLKIYSRLARAFGGRGRPAAFWYTRLEDELGNTKARKDGTLDPDNKRIRFLDPLISCCYDTLQVVSSPILDRMRDEAKFQYYVDILKGKIKPQAKCTECDGTRVYHYSEFFVQKDDGSYGIERMKFFPEQLYFDDWLRQGKEDCPHCDARGYYYPENHPDYAVAESMREQLSTSLQRTKGRKIEVDA
jgi:hypothetical protein